MAEDIVWDLAQRPDEDGKVFWKDRKEYFSFKDVQEHVTAIEAALRERERDLRELIHDLCENALGKDCQPKCDSYGHMDDCGATNVLAYVKQLKAENSRLRKLDAEEAE